MHDDVDGLTRDDAIEDVDERLKVLGSFVVRAELDDEFEKVRNRPRILPG